LFSAVGLVAAHYGRDFKYQRRCGSLRVTFDIYHLAFTIYQKCLAKFLNDK
jgi:hypothetical protein